MINLEKLQLYQAEKDGNTYYGSVIWKSMFRARLYKEEQGNLYRQQQIINFKNRNINKKYFKKVVEVIENYFITDLTIVVPGSSVKLTNLQKLLNNTYITRIKEVSQMKYREKRKIEESEVETLHIKWAEIKGNKILLIDDMITTGSTMEFYKQILKTKINAEFICYGFGLNNKLNPVHIKDLSYEVNDDINIDELLNSIEVVI